MVGFVMTQKNNPKFVNDSKGSKSACLANTLLPLSLWTHISTALFLSCGSPWPKLVDPDATPAKAGTCNSYSVGSRLHHRAFIWWVSAVGSSLHLVCPRHPAHYVSLCSTSLACMHTCLGIIKSGWGLESRSWPTRPCVTSGTYWVLATVHWSRY